MTSILEFVLVGSVISESVAGTLSAGRKGMDPVGVIIIAFVTALGGGTLRDLLLASGSILWINNPYFVWLVIATASIVMIARRYMIHLLGLFLVMDAIGLCGLSLIGLNKALTLGWGYTVAVVSGLCTGVFGGILRDILCGDIPWVFRKELYATISLVTCFIYLFLSNYLPLLNQTAALLIAMGVGITLRMSAIRYNIRLPVFYFNGDK